MFKPFFLFVGYRYAHSKRRNHFISFISLTSMLGIAIGVTVLITVLSVYNGFNVEIRAKMLNVTPHIILRGIDEPVLHWQELLPQVLATPGVTGAAPYIIAQGLFVANGISFLHLAEDREVHAALLRCASINVNVRDNMWRTPLMAAVLHPKHKTLVKDLLEHPFLDLLARDRDGKIALDHALEVQTAEGREICNLIRAKMVAKGLIAPATGTATQFSSARAGAPSLRTIAESHVETPNRETDSPSLNCALM